MNLKNNKSVIGKSIYQYLNENKNYQILNENPSIEEFEQFLSNLSTLELEDDEVRYPKFIDGVYVKIIQILGMELYLIGKNKLTTGPFEILLVYEKKEFGFIRGSINLELNYVTFNLIYLEPDDRGQGIGSNIYEYFLNEGFTIKSDSEITDDTFNMYMSLVRNKGYKPLLFTDGKVGVKK